jgi:hypothetical protein
MRHGGHFIGREGPCSCAPPRGTVIGCWVRSGLPYKAVRMRCHEASPCSHQPPGVTRQSSGLRHTPSARHSAMVSSSGGAHPLFTSNQAWALRIAPSADVATTPSWPLIGGS